jgi:hypothetical protein
LKFIEHNWNVEPMAKRDANANNFLSAFDFKQAPRQAEFLSLSRADTTSLKKVPTSIIYAAYGIALFLCLLAIGFAFFFRREPKTTPVDGRN